MNSQPGWYPDPQNPTIVRYWDGQQWTNQTQASQPSYFQGPSASPKKGKVLIPILAVLGGLIVIFVGVNILAGPAPSPTMVESKPAKVEQSISDSSTYREVDERELALILKDPDTNKGERIIVYGQIWQFDTRTGPDRFLADIGTNPLGIGNNQSAQLIGTESSLKTLVSGDKVRMHVIVDGEYSYTSTADHKLTVPQFQIGIIQPVE